jgi:hypothetical protein
VVATGTAGILVLACDGVFDVMSDQECLEFVANKFKELSAPPPSDSKSEAGRDQYLATALARALVQVRRVGAPESHRGDSAMKKKLRIVTLGFEKGP